MSLIIAHSAAEGTVVWGTSRGDGSAEILKTHRWRWGRSLGAWYLPRTRGQRPNQVCIEQTAHALREAGFTVELDLDDRTRPAAEVEADRILRQQQRTNHLQTQADRAAAAADGHGGHALRRRPGETGGGGGGPQGGGGEGWRAARQRGRCRHGQ